MKMYALFEIVFLLKPIVAEVNMVSKKIKRKLEYEGTS